jgi:hypothetical protein
MYISNRSCSVVLESREPLLKVINVIGVAIVSIHVDDPIHLGNWPGLKSLGHDVVHQDGVLIHSCLPRFVEILLTLLFVPTGGVMMRLR